MSTLNLYRRRLLLAVGAIVLAAAAHLTAEPGEFDRVGFLRELARAAGVAHRWPRRPFPVSAWWFTLQTNTLNVAYPDTNAVYWGTPFFDDGNTEIRIEGQFIDQRYFSLTTYTQDLNFFDYTTPQGEVFSSFLADFQIDPEVPGTKPGNTVRWAYQITRLGPA